MASPAPPLFLNRRRSAHFDSQRARPSSSRHPPTSSKPTATNATRRPTMLPARKPVDEVILRPTRAMSCSQHCPQSFAAPHDPLCPYAQMTPSYAGIPGTPLSLQIGEVSEELLLADVPLTPVARERDDAVPRRDSRRQSAIQKLKTHVRKMSWAVAHRKEPKDSGYVSKDPRTVNFDGIDPFSDDHAIRESDDTARAGEEVEKVNWHDVDDSFPPLIRVRASTEPIFPPVKKRSLFDRVFRRRSAPCEKTAPVMKRRPASWRALVISRPASTTVVDEEDIVLATAQEEAIFENQPATAWDPADQERFDELCTMLSDRLYEREENGDFDAARRAAWYARYHGNRTTPQQQAEASRKLAAEVEENQRDRMRKFRRQQERLQMAADPDGQFRGRQIKRVRYRAVSMPLPDRPRDVTATAFKVRTESGTASIPLLDSPRELLATMPTKRAASESEASFKLWLDSEMDVAPDSAFNPID